jgi:hypothetical protein
MSASEHWKNFKEKELEVTSEKMKINIQEFVDKMLEMFEEVFKKGYKSGYNEAKTEIAKGLNDLTGE